MLNYQQKLTNIRFLKKIYIYVYIYEHILIIKPY